MPHLIGRGTIFVSAANEEGVQGEPPGSPAMAQPWCINCGAASVKTFKCMACWINTMETGVSTFTMQVDDATEAFMKLGADLDAVTKQLDSLHTSPGQNGKALTASAHWPDPALDLRSAVYKGLISRREVVSQIAAITDA